MKLKKKKQTLTTEQYIPIKELKNNKVYLKDGSILGYIFVSPKDISLKKDSEKELVIKNYSNIYKSLTSGEIQTISNASSTNISDNVAYLEQLKSQETNLIKRKILHQEIQMVLDYSMKTVERNSYLVIKDIDERKLDKKLKQYVSQLKNAEMKVKILNNREIKDLLFAYYNQEYTGKIKEYYL